MDADSGPKLAAHFGDRRCESLQASNQTATICVWP